MKATKLIFGLFVIFLFIATVILHFGSEPRIKLATTTSLQNSGLLDFLLPKFERDTGIRVDVIAVGTGKALKLGRTGDVDVVLVHAPSAEEEFVKDGFGLNRIMIMYNDFVIVGPSANPARITNDPIDAFKKIAQTKAYFVSRGDDSGTHKKEKELWSLAGVKPRGDWYLEVGQGMGQTLCIANEKKAYCLVDRGTFLAYREKIDLVILCEGRKEFVNPYSIIPINPQVHSNVRYNLVKRLVKWFCQAQTQELIGSYTKNGQVLFHPALAYGPLNKKGKK
jgi:tungstate transport system substrate-binding protein